MRMERDITGDLTAELQPLGNSCAGREHSAVPASTLSPRNVAELHPTKQSPPHPSSVGARRVYLVRRADSGECGYSGADTSSIGCGAVSYAGSGIRLGVLVVERATRGFEVCRRFYVRQQRGYRL